MLALQCNITIMASNESRNTAALGGLFYEQTIFRISKRNPSRIHLQNIYGRQIPDMGNLHYLGEGSSKAGHRTVLVPAGKKVKPIMPRCRKCGKALTDDLSIRLGIGPVCGKRSATRNTNKYGEDNPDQDDLFTEGEDNEDIGNNGIGPDSERSSS
jgi:hypothetical protein